jgi:hypothetical protein
MNSGDNVLISVTMPDGKPSPFLLTPSEAISFLRIDTINRKHPNDTLNRLREYNGLRCVRISNTIFYPLTELIRFLDASLE